MRVRQSKLLINILKKVIPKRFIENPFSFLTLQRHDRIDGSREAGRDGRGRGRRGRRARRAGQKSASRQPDKRRPQLQCRALFERFCIIHSIQNASKNLDLSRLSERRLVSCFVFEIKKNVYFSYDTKRPDMFLLNESIYNMSTVSAQVPIKISKH